MAFVDGKLDREEYDERQALCLNAKYIDELEHLVTDLGGQQVMPFAAPAAAPVALGGEPIKTFAVMSGKDIYLTPDRPSVEGFAFWGGDDIHVAGVMGPGVQIELSLVSIMGGHDVYVPEGVRVVDESVSFMGGVSIKKKARGDGSNGTVIIRGFNFMGGVDVKLEK